MQRLLIFTTNCALLALLLIGLPAATRVQLGDWQIASASTARRLLFWGLAVATAGNLSAGMCLVKGRRMKFLCLEWTAIFAGLLLIFWGFDRGYFNFNWLKQALLWVQNHF